MMRKTNTIALKCYYYACRTVVVGVMLTCESDNSDIQDDDDDDDKKKAYYYYYYADKKKLK